MTSTANNRLAHTAASNYNVSNMNTNGKLEWQLNKCGRNGGDSATVFIITERSIEMTATKSELYNLQLHCK